MFEPIYEKELQNSGLAEKRPAQTTIALSSHSLMIGEQKLRLRATLVTGDI